MGNFSEVMFHRNHTVLLFLPTLFLFYFFWGGVGFFNYRSIETPDRIKNSSIKFIIYFSLVRTLLFKMYTPKSSLKKFSEIKASVLALKNFCGKKVVEIKSL